MASPEPDHDAKIRALCEAGHHHAAATSLLEIQGPDVYSFLAALLRSDTKADDVFSQFCEDLWRGLPSFQWKCTSRAWVFTLARNAAFSYTARADHRRERNLPLSGIREVEERIRTETAPYRKTVIKDRFRALRERLDQEDQIILILRVDKKLSWAEVSQVLADDQEDGQALQKRSARIRKRFQLIKDKLRVWAVEDGLLPESE